MNNHHITTKTTNHGRYTLIIWWSLFDDCFCYQKRIDFYCFTNDYLIICVKHRCFSGANKNEMFFMCIKV